MAKRFDPEIGRATRWKAGGASPNPAGRPRSKVLTDAYRAVLAQRFPGDKQKRTYAEVIAHKIADEAANGNLRAVAELADRTGDKLPEGIGSLQPEESPELENFDEMSDEELWQRLTESALSLDRTFKHFGRNEELEALRALNPS